jgi:hypothetical protein
MPDDEQAKPWEARRQAVDAADRIMCGRPVPSIVYRVKSCEERGVFWKKTRVVECGGEVSHTLVLARHTSAAPTSVC